MAEKQQNFAIFCRKLKIARRMMQDLKFRRRPVPLARAQRLDDQPEFHRPFGPADEVCENSGEGGHGIAGATIEVGVEVPFVLRFKRNMRSSSAIVCGSSHDPCGPGTTHSDFAPSRCELQ